MATVTGLTATRMLAIEAESVVGGLVDVHGHLILSKHDSSTIDAGLVLGSDGSDGAVGATGPMGPMGPTGAVSMFAGQYAPPAWLICDGSSISQVIYAALASILGTTYGTGAAAINRTNCVYNPKFGGGITTDWTTRSPATVTLVTQNGSLWAVAPVSNYVYALAQTTIGRYYAASMLVNGPPGTTFSLGSTDDVVGAWCDSGTVTIPPSGQMTVTAVSTVPVLSGACYFGINNPPAQLLITQAYVENVPGPGMGPTGTYFSGDTASSGTLSYHWTGTAQVSPSYEQETNTVALPNFKGRVPVGVDSTQTEFATLGKTGGEKTHLLITSEMPSHTHTWQTDSSGGGFASGFAGIGSAARINTANFTLTPSTGATGGGGAHNILQPYLALNYIIKT